MVSDEVRSHHQNSGEAGVSKDISGDKGLSSGGTKLNSVFITAEKMPPKRTAATITPAPMTDTQIKALIAHGVADALVEIKANRTSRNGYNSHDSGTSSRRTERAAREYTYSDFLKYQPLNLKGTEGVVSLTQCALTWWNSYVKIVGHDAAYEMSWKTLKKIMTAKYYPRGEIKKLKIKLWNLKVKEFDEVEKYVGGLPDMIQGSVMAYKPKTMQDAIEFATEL
ncbi:reverse transcriptase domain-containing protein, partial [Tanacetum coccineum]